MVFKTFESLCPNNREYIYFSLKIIQNEWYTTTLLSTKLPLSTILIRAFKTMIPSWFSRLQNDSNLYDIFFCPCRVWKNYNIFHASNSIQLMHKCPYLIITISIFINQLVIVQFIQMPLLFGNCWELQRSQRRNPYLHWFPWYCTPNFTILSIFNPQTKDTKNT